jgi:hypothetical protein
MSDDPQAEACAANGPMRSERDEPALNGSRKETLYEQVAKVLPRLTSMGTSVALLGPLILYGSESFGRRGGC